MSEEAVVEQWAQIAHCRAEISNGGMCRHSVTKKIIKPAENGLVRVINDAGYACDKSVRGECRKAFGHPPIKYLYFPERYQQAMPEPVDEPEESTEDHWQPVLIEGVIEGYEVNEEAQIMAPASAHRRGPRTILKREPWKSGVRMQLRMVAGGQARFRLDEIVLEAFEPRPSGNWIAQHLDDDQENCRRSNLKWVEGRHARARVIKSEPSPVPITTPEPETPPVTLTSADIGTSHISPIVTYPEPAVPAAPEIVKTHTYTDSMTGLTVGITDGKLVLPDDVPVTQATHLSRLLTAVAADL